MAAMPVGATSAAGEWPFRVIVDVNRNLQTDWVISAGGTSGNYLFHSLDPTQLYWLSYVDANNTRTSNQNSLRKRRCHRYQPVASNVLLAL